MTSSSTLGATVAPERQVAAAAALAAGCALAMLAVVQVVVADGALAVAFVLAAAPLAFLVVQPRWVPALFFALVWAAADEHLPRISPSVEVGRFSFSLPSLSLVQVGLVALVAVAVVVVARRPREARTPLLAAALLGLPLVSAALASPAGTALPFKDLAELGFLPVAALVARGAGDADRAAVALCAMGAALGAGAVFSIAVHPTEFFPINETNFAVGDAARAAGPFGEANFFALSMAALVPLAGHVILRGGARAAVGAVAAPLLLAGVLATGSRGATIAALVGLVFFAIVSGSRAARWCVAGVIVCGLALLPFFAGQAHTSRNRAVGGRLTENRIAVAMFADHPVFGVGPNRYRELYSGYSRRMGDDPRPVREAHSLPLEIAAEQGLVGVLGWLAAGVAIALAAARSRVWREPVARALVGAIITYGVGSLFLHGSQLRLPFLLAGLLLAVCAGAGRRSGEPA